MPAKIQPSATPTEATEDGARKNLEKSIRAHLARLTRVSMERRKQGLTKNRFLSTEVEVSRGVGEPDDDLVESVLDSVFEAIGRDADGGPWLGRVHLHDDNAAKKNEQTLDVVDVRIEDADAIVTRDGEVNAIIATVGVFLEKQLSNCIRLVQASEKRETAIAELVSNVAKSVGSYDAKHAKYEYKRWKEEQATEQLRIRELGRTRRSEARWNTFGETAETYHDVVKQWSDLVMQAVQDDRKSAKLRAPTQAEVDTVFAGEAFDSFRACASEMIATASRPERIVLAKRFRQLMDALTDEQKSVLLARAAALGEQRARECLAWLANPRSNP